MNIGSLLHGRCWGWREAEVKRKAKRPTDSGNATNNVSAINRAAVPGVSSGMGSFDEDGVGATIIGGDGNSFIQKPVEVFDANSLVIAASSDMNVDVQNRTDGLEEAFESAAVIDNNQPAKADF
jgi:hypothetical protein